MTEFKMKLMTINDVKEFVALASLCRFDLDLNSGRYTVDAKSIMGIFSIVPSESLTLTVYASPDECADFLKQIAKFAV